MKRFLILCACLAVFLAGATACKDRFNTKGAVVAKSIFIETKGVDVSGDTKFIAEMHALVANSVELTAESFEKGDIGFEYGKKMDLSGEVTKVEADSWWIDEEDLLGRKGFSGRAMPLPPSEIFYYRAFLKKDGKTEYGVIYSFRTDDAMVIAVYLDRNEATLTLGETDNLQLTATIDPLTAINREVEWSSSDDKVASVSSSGLVTAHRPGNANITVTTQEGGKTATCKVTVKGPSPKAVDLGLSVKWADINIGAMSESDPGCYFAWGETKTKDTYSIFGYPYHMSGDKNPPAVLTADVDAATVNLGSPWRMPTKAEYEELLSSCTWEKTSVGGREGWRATSNGKSVFFPMGGYMDDNNLLYDGEKGHFYSATHDHGPKANDTDYCFVYIFNIDGNECRIHGGVNGAVGRSVRAVRP